MRLVRLDHLPGGRSLELHPRLAVVHGAPPAVHDLVADVLRSILAGEPVAYDGQIEVDGVRLGLRDRIFDVSSGSAVDPVLDLAAPSPLRPVIGATRRRSTPADRVSGPVVDVPSSDAPADRPDAAEPTGAVTATPPGVDPAARTRRIAAEDLVRLRRELKDLDGQRTVLARAADEARADLDSFARATLDVAVGQLAAVEARRAAVDEEFADWRAEHAHRRSELVARADLLRVELSTLTDRSSAPVREALARLVSLRSAGTGVDPRARALADELEDLRRSMEELETRRMAVEGFLADAESQLEAAHEELEAARSSIRSPELDPVVVTELEAIRDEIFELEERGGRVAAVRARRRIDELRSEEALLLDRLGFDTYTAFVMGTPNRETESVRASREDRARSRVDQLVEEVDRLREELPGGAEDLWNQAERSRIVAESAELIGTTAEGLGRLTTVELVDLLNTQPLQPSPAASAEVLAASGRLAAALVAAGAPAPGAAADPDAMEELAGAWLADEQHRIQRRATLEQSLDDAVGELDLLDRSSRRADDGGRGADLDAELSALRRRVADGEAAVERHERATAELAEIRGQELELRDRERDLLVRISDRERLFEVLGSAVAPPEPPDAPPVNEAGPPILDLPKPTDPGAAEALRRTVDRDASVVWPVDREWLLLSRLGEVRSVGPVGSIPLLVSGIDAAAMETPALLHRIASMSELVQIVVLASDERLSRWADGLASDARLVRW